MMQPTLCQRWLILFSLGEIHIMSRYHHTTIKRRPLHSNPDQAKPVAEVVFEAENPHTATSSILDALDALGIPRADSATLTEFGGIERLDSFPFGPDAGKPDWSNESVKVWLIDSPNQDGKTDSATRLRSPTAQG